MLPRQSSTTESQHPNISPKKESPQVDKLQKKDIRTTSKKKKKKKKERGRPVGALAKKSPREACRLTARRPA